MHPITRSLSLEHQPNLTSAHTRRTQRSGEVTQIRKGRGQRTRKTHKGINQNRIIQSPNPARIQRLVVENLNPLQKSQSLQPLQPRRLVNIRRDFSGLPTFTEELRSRVARLTGSGKGERAGGGGGGLGPGVQTRRGSRETEDVGQHFLSGVVVYG